MEKGNKKIWSDDSAFDTKIFSNPCIKRSQDNLNKLFNHAPGPTKTLMNKQLPPMKDPDRDNIPNIFDKQPFIHNKNKVNDILKRRINYNKKIGRIL